MRVKKLLLVVLLGLLLTNNGFSEPFGKNDKWKACSPTYDFEIAFDNTFYKTYLNNQKLKANGVEIGKKYKVIAIVHHNETINYMDFDEKTKKFVPKQMHEKYIVFAIQGLLEPVKVMAGHLTAWSQIKAMALPCTNLQPQQYKMLMQSSQKVPGAKPDENAIIGYLDINSSDADSTSVQVSRASEKEVKAKEIKDKEEKASGSDERKPKNAEAAISL